MAALFSPQLHFFIGKGGVGKTTLATAFALAAARLGKTTLLIEFDGNTRAARLLGLPVDTQETGLRQVDPVCPTLSVLAVSGQAALEEYLRLSMPASRLLRLVFESQLYQYFVTAAPGLKELLMMGKVWHEAHKSNPDQQPVWDMVIVDTPATGHSLQYLNMPWAARETFQTGIVHRETERIMAFLSDPQSTAVHLVTTPEDLPVSETLEAYNTLVEDGKFPLGRLFINRMHTAGMSRTRLAKAQIAPRVPSHARQLSQQVLAWAHTQADLAHAQKAFLSKLEQLPLPAIQLPFCFAETFGLAQVERLSSLIETGWQVRERAHRKSGRSGS
jgi:anion-transporting  ArsA/GET3 family ATPase